MRQLKNFSFDSITHSKPKKKKLFLKPQIEKKGIRTNFHFDKWIEIMLKSNISIRNDFFFDRSSYLFVGKIVPDECV